MGLRALWSRYPILVTCIFAGLAAAVVVLAYRYRVEQASRTVEITLDGDDWVTLVRRTGVNWDGFYPELYRAGVRSITVYASSLRRLADAGRLTYMTGADIVNAGRSGPVRGPVGDLLRAGRINPASTYAVGAPRTLEEVRTRLALQLPPRSGASRVNLLEGSGPVLEIQGRGQDIEDATLGLLPEDTAPVRAHHLAVEARLRNFREVSDNGVDAFFAGLRALRQPLTLISDGTQVLGYDELIPQVGREIKDSGFAYGQIEAFTARRRQRGDLDLAREAAPNVLRVFSLAPEELAPLRPADARDKYVLAARERNVRVLYVRPFLGTGAGVDQMQANLDYVRSIADELERAGYRMGKATPLPNVAIPPLSLVLMALGTLAATSITVAEVARVFGRSLSLAPLYAGTAIGVLITALMIAVHHVTLWSQILAFLASLAFPTLSLMAVLLPQVSPAPVRDRDGLRPGGMSVLLASLWRLWELSALTALGGIMVAALLSQWLFMMEVREFLGVKMAHIVPVVLIGLLLVASEEPRGEVWQRLRAWTRQPLLLGYGIILILVGMAAIFALGRTGNAGLPALGSLELKSRAILSHLVVARPRTKEYLIGHPFMVLAFALAAVGARRWVLPAAIVGAVGQVGLVNSFSHIHTPLVYIFDRTLYALIFGSAIGAILVGLLLWGRRRWPSRVHQMGVPERSAARAWSSPMR